MEFGISFLPDVAPGTMSASEYYQGVLALSRLADRLGYSHVKMTEHYLHPYGGYCPSPLNFLTAVAAQTERIRLMTGCLLPSFHHPVKIASYTAMVDAISNGRLDVGYARAYLPYEFETFDVPMDGSRERFEATIAAVTELWTQENATRETPYFSYRDATTLPRPVQAPHPPTYVAAVRTPSSFSRIGELGHGLLITPGGLDMPADRVRAYREAFQPRTAAMPEPRVVASLPLLVGESVAEANRLADRYLQNYLDVWTSAVDSWNNVSSSDYASYSGMSRFLRTMSGTDLRLTGSAIVGTPDMVIDRIHRFVEQVGQVDSILWQVDFGGMPYEVAAPSLQLFADEVMPKLAG
ncbi:LLM class flavin-dependent oxidoreductase [Kitasatospora sp. NPDC089797]|uniref:LLM class flavin-dependent oxidoreductase n=1 Tax=Kitasatospora sp. NPDC089797 TaxID=3155298 RepID=UPI00343DD206